MSIPIPDTLKFPCRSPHGGRGLKSSTTPISFLLFSSLSSRRAWIEIRVYPKQRATCSVALLTEGVD